MISFDVKPTYENLLELMRKDSISRNKDVISFVTLLSSLDKNISIGLNGAWGSGKTFFVKQTKMILDAFNEFVQSESAKDRTELKSIWKTNKAEGTDEPQSQVVVYYDCWESDTDEDPILSLVYAIVQQVSTDFNLKKKKDFFEKAAAVLSIFKGQDWNSLIQSFQSDDPMQELAARRDVRHKISEFLESILVERGNRLVVIIDELDRCNPQYAVQLLERIKHYFENENITFVFSTNISELRHTIRQYYGNDFDACRYLDRFFDLRLELPPADLEKYLGSIKLQDSEYIYDAVCAEVIKKYKFTLREISRYVSITKIAASKIAHGNSMCSFSTFKGVQFGILYIVPIMIGLNICDINRYQLFLQGKDSSPMLEIASNVYAVTFSSLLAMNEIFEHPRADQRQVTREDKLSRVYEAIFNHNYNNFDYQVTIGDCTFTKDTKNTLLRVAGLFSDYTDYTA